MKKTIHKLARAFYWPKIGRDVSLWIRQCDVCQRKAALTYKAPLVPLPVIQELWSQVAFDLVGPLPKTKPGHHYLLKCMDLTTHCPKAVPLCRVDAQSVVTGMMEIFSQFGVSA